MLREVPVPWRQKTGRWLLTGGHVLSMSAPQSKSGETATGLRSMRDDLCASPHTCKTDDHAHGHAGLVAFLGHPKSLQPDSPLRTRGATSADEEEAPLVCAWYCTSASLRVQCTMTRIVYLYNRRAPRARVGWRGSSAPYAPLIRVRHPPH